MFKFGEFCPSREWMELGANVIGGCCRSGPDAIAKIKEAVAENMLDALQKRREEATFERDNRDDVEEKLKRMRANVEPHWKKKKKLEEEERKKKLLEEEEKEDKSLDEEEKKREEKSLDECLRKDFTMVPGYMTQGELDGEVRAMVKALQDV